MRYYDLEIVPTGSASGLSYSSKRADGSNNPGALNVEFDGAVYNAAAPMGFPHIKVWGIPYNVISQATNLNGAKVTLSAGMQAGLPLAKPGQAGIIFVGTVFQAFGNWIGTEMTLELYVQTDGGATQSAPKNITLQWLKGQQLGAALAQTLQTAYPGFTVVNQTSAKLVLTEDDNSFHETVQQLGSYAADVSRSILPDGYAGVNISFLGDGKTILIFDGTAPPSSTIQIAFEDMIGQPVWLGPYTVQVVLVMRADIAVGAAITFPQGSTSSGPALLTTHTQEELGQQGADASAFSGTWSVTSVRHIGNFRTQDAAAWATVITATTSPPSASSDPQDPDSEG